MNSSYSSLLLAQDDGSGFLGGTISEEAMRSLLIGFPLFVVEIGLACGIIYLFYFLLTIPMRRNERARLFLDLLELGLSEGQTPERAIIDASSSRDTAPGVRFHFLAAHLETGMKFGEALKQVPRLLPPQIVAMLRTGGRIGDMAKVLPACRKQLGDGVSQARGALNYLIILVFAITPFTISIPLAIRILVIPKFLEAFYGFGGGGTLPAFTQFIIKCGGPIAELQLGVVAVIWVLMICYVGGPRIHGWSCRLLPGVADRVLFLLPWRRKRLQRDFSAMLAVLLDAEVPEADAVSLAAECAANGVFKNRAVKVCAQLRNGVKLPEALRLIDDTGELHWRLSNALQRRSGFLPALAGWHESLDARAFQLEQGAAQATTSAVVIFNGVVVAGVVIGLFIVLIDLISQATLW